MKHIADTITVEEVNTIARSLLSYVSHYSAEKKAAAEAAGTPEEWMDFGVSRATSIVACVPAYMDASGKSAGGCPASGCKLGMASKATRPCVCSRSVWNAAARSYADIRYRRTRVSMGCHADDVAGDGRPLQRGASMTTSEHVDPAAVPSVDAALNDEDDPSDVRHPPNTQHWLHPPPHRHEVVQRKQRCNLCNRLKGFCVRFRRFRRVQCGSS